MMKNKLILIIFICAIARILLSSCDNENYNPCKIDYKFKYLSSKEYELNYNLFFESSEKINRYEINLSVFIANKGGYWLVSKYKKENPQFFESGEIAIFSVIDSMNMIRGGDRIKIDLEVTCDATTKYETFYEFAKN